jgi:hypothetical protein
MLFFLLTFASELIYQDNFGNEFVIENPQKLPKEIDFEFLKSNLNTKHFIENFVRKSYNYKFVVMKAQKKSKNVYELKVQIIPQTKDDVQVILRHTNPSYYILKTTNRNKKVEIESVKFDRGEI